MPTAVECLALAREHHQAGRFDEAEALYRGVLAETPQDARLLHLLGVLAHQTGRHDESIGLITQALAVQGPHASLYSNLAAVYLAVGRLDEAERYARTALQLEPELASAHYNLGVALQRRGERAEADAALREALRYDPDHIGARRRLAQAPLSVPQLTLLEAQLSEVVRVEPANAQAWYDLAILRISTDRPEQAIEPLQTAIRLRPEFIDAYLRLGGAWHQLGQSDAALDCYRDALEIDPDNMSARSSLGQALKNLGRAAEALAEFQAILRYHPEDTAALYPVCELAVEGHYRLTDEERQHLEALAARADLSIDDSCRVHYSLAQLADKADDCEKAFEHARRANAMRAQIDAALGAVFDPDEHRRFIDRTIAYFTPAYFERTRGFGADSELPVFVVGMMRSGTTLAEQILASHPQAYGASELRDIGLLVVNMPSRLGTAEQSPECLDRLDAQMARSLAEEHLRKLQRRGGGASRVVDKHPYNFLYLGMIATLWPRARIVHCRRDPLDTCLSCFFRNFADPFPFRHDLRHLGMYYRDYERLMAHWNKVVPIPIFDLRYEELTAEPEAVIRRLIAYCGLEWDDRCLRFYETQRPVRTASMLQVRKPMYRSAVGRWKRYEAQLRPLMEELQIAPSAT
jgi:tetratricopeptide (TPR) repeat protein